MIGHILRVHLSKAAVMAFICIVVCASLGGCVGTKSLGDDTFGVYHINNDQTGIVKTAYDLTGDTESEQIMELKRKLSENDKNSENSCAIPEGVSITEYELINGGLSLHFNRAYSELKGNREALLRAAVVRTYLQLDYVNSVSFYIADEALMDKAGNVIGEMTNESFLMSFGAEEEAPESGSFVLYYSSADGKKLLKKQRSVYYNNNLMAEEVVLKNLARTPETEDGARPALAGSTKVLSVTTSDGICYVDLDSSFLNQGNNVSMDVAVYAIVNSLSALENVNKVQLIINGEEESHSSGEQSVSGIYEADFSLIQK